MFSVTRKAETLHVLAFPLGEGAAHLLRRMRVTLPNFTLFRQTDTLKFATLRKITLDKPVVSCYTTHDD